MMNQEFAMYQENIMSYMPHDPFTMVRLSQLEYL